MTLNRSPDAQFPGSIDNSASLIIIFLISLTIKTSFPFLLSSVTWSYLMHIYANEDALHRARNSKKEAISFFIPNMR